MTKLKFLCIAMTLVIMSSCSTDDDDSPATVSNDLLGTWVGATVNYTTTSTTDFQGQTFTVESLGKGYDVDYSLNFAEPNVLTVNGTYSVELTITSFGQTTTQNVEDIEFGSDGTWIRNENELTYLANGETQNITITELTTTKMTLVTVKNTTEVEEGMTIVNNVKMIATYTKR